MPFWFKLYRGDLRINFISVLGTLMTDLCVVLLVGVATEPQMRPLLSMALIGLAMGLGFFYLARKWARESGAEPVSFRKKVDAQPKAEQPAQTPRPAPQAKAEQPAPTPQPAQQEKVEQPVPQPQPAPQPAPAQAKAEQPAPQPAPAQADAAPGEMSADETVALAIRYQEAGDLAQAIRILRHGEDLYPDCAGLLNQLGIALRTNGENEEALSCYGRAMALEPDNGVFVLNYAIAETAGGNPQAALFWFEKALPMLKAAKSDKFATALGNYALALGKCGYRDDAVSRLKEAEKQGYRYVPQMRKMLEELGIYYH